MTIYHAQNVVPLCEKRKMFISKIKVHADGVQHPAIETCIQSDNYKSVLYLIWADGNLTRRLTWLREKVSTLHPLLMYEQAIAEFQVAPTVETVLRISLPLIKAASFRVCQDAQCSFDASVFYGDINIRLETAYGKALMDEMEKHTLNLKSIFMQQPNKDTFKAAVSIKLKDIKNRSLNNPETLASPVWVGFHGIQAPTAGHASMLPFSQFAGKRSKAAAYKLKDY